MPFAATLRATGANCATTTVARTSALRLFSVYRDAAGRRFYVITEHDRSGTTVLLPEDY